MSGTLRTTPASATRVPLATTTEARSRVVLLAGSLLTLATVVMACWACWLTVNIADVGVWRIALGLTTFVVVGAALSTTVPLIRGMVLHKRGTRALSDGAVFAARADLHRSTAQGWAAMGYCLPVLMIALFTLFLLSNDHAVQSTFFDADFMIGTLGEISVAFLQNAQIAVLAEALVLVWGLLIALCRLVPGDAGRPVRWLATAYVDVFRAIPAIIVIYLIGFGLPLAHVPVLSQLSPMWAAVLALTLTYGAYVAEVYRAGIDSVHWSQVSAARSLGLSYGKTMRFVVVPQAIRRVIPPLLNDFIGLQKDTALVTVIGTVDAFTQAKIFASNYFNLSSVTVVAVIFVLVTIPQTRLVDRLIERDRRRQRA